LCVPAEQIVFALKLFNMKAISVIVALLGLVAAIEAQKYTHSQALSKIQGAGK